jgi:hypothetical protein
MNRRRKRTTKEGADTMNATAERPCSIRESIVQSCKEVKLMREGKQPKRTWKELREELKKIKSEAIK